MQAKPVMRDDLTMHDEDPVATNGHKIVDTHERNSGRRNGTRADRPRRIDTIVIGGGQAGLAAGYALQRRGVPFLILDAADRVGDSWRNRWDSLRLFTPAKFSSLEGMPFPAHGDYFPTKDEMAAYLASYAARFNLPVHHGVRVDSLSRSGDRFVLAAGSQRYEARNVVVAMSNYQRPRIPEFARELDPSILQLHSIDYRNPNQMQEGGVLVVGAGNSGADIAMELRQAGHPVWLSGRSTGHIPFRIDGFAGRKLLVRFVLRVLFQRVITVDTPIGRKARPKILAQGGPLIRVKPSDLKTAGIERVPRVMGVRNGRPVLEDGRTLSVSNVIWCTGFHPGFSWIKLPILDASGEPEHHKGVVEDVPGLYFVGLHFLYALSSSMIQGVTRDAARIADDIVKRAASRFPAELPAYEQANA